MKFTYKIEKHALWQAAIVTGGLIAGAKLKIELGIIPLTLQTLSLCVTVLYFGRQANLLGTLLYMIAGLYFPVFSDNVFGKEFYQGYTAGYVVSFPLAVLLLSGVKDKFKDWFTIFSWLLMAHALILICGVAWGTFYKGLPLLYTIKNGFYSLLPAAILKSVIVSVLYWVIKKYLPSAKETEE